MNNILMDNVINIINESKSLVLEVKNNLIINIFNENDIRRLFYQKKYLELLETAFYKCNYACRSIMLENGKGSLKEIKEKSESELENAEILSRDTVMTNENGVLSLKVYVECIIDIAEERKIDT